MSNQSKNLINSTIKWVNGEVRHDCKHVHNECLPDFSCCNPKFFEKDINKRMNALARVINNVRHVQEINKLEAG